ncbi:MAG: nodulation protein NfeD [Armatimonadota bacterium]|nr:nodulation protein NfeD [Armatimonadota bacterium]MDR7439248.1 nodulation protein NfeD [Armatimonadota bacterium]MDR7563289.1 nodulation protein NfeD [Armatimonadota bacterium]MDR7567763.1 nodulation protein NfeD [Armatimonadota bacterium]MDR7602643.1 nodulation protein NfeD [Armatimonadota bacterium]
MRRLLWSFCLVVLMAWVPLWAATPRPRVYLLRVEGIISPATAIYIQRGIREAERAGAEALVVELDTPGGLMTSMDQITKAILASPVPVIVYVSPPGARAGSAGVFILYAAHVAAMAPTTNVGAATPVFAGGGDQQETENQRALQRKVTEDAVARIRTLAHHRGRNAEWGERAVREAASIPAEEAVRLRVVDLLARDVRDLLNRVDGRVAEVRGERVTLTTRGAETVHLGMDLRERMLDLLADPNIGLILLTIGIYGIIFELNNPGAIFPGIVGAIALVLGLTSLAILQVNYAGLALIGLAVLLFLADLFIPGHGILSVGGVISFILGAILLTSNQEPYLRLSVELAVAIALLSAAFFLFAVGAGLRAQRRRPATGREALLGAVGEARSELAPQGVVFVQGELWTAESVDGRIPEGSRVRVVEVEGLRLKVRKEGTA